MLRLNQAATQKFSNSILLFLILIFGIVLAKVLVRSPLLAAIALFVPITALGLITAKVEVFLLFIFATRSLIDNFWSIPLFSLGAKNINLLMVWGMLIPCLAVILLLRNRINIVNHSIARPMLLSVFVNLLAVIISPFKLEAIGYFFRVVGGYPIFFLAAACSINREKIDKFIKIALFACLLTSIFAIYQRLGGISYYQTTMGGALYRTAGFYHDVGTISLYMMLSIPIVVFLYYNSHSISKRIIYISFMAILLFTLFLAYHRAGWIIVVIQLVLWSIMSRRFLIAGMCITFTATFILMLPDQHITSFISGFFAPLTIVFYSRGLPDVAFSGRVGAWKVLLQDFLGRSLITRLLGTGLSTTYSITALYPSMTPTMDAHNDYIRILVENGIVGIMVHIWLLWTLGKSALIVYLKSKDFYLRNLAQLFILLLVALILISITLRPSQYPSFNWYIFGFAGIVSHIQTRLNTIIISRHAVDTKHFAL